VKYGISLSICRRNFLPLSSVPWMEQQVTPKRRYKSTTLHGMLEDMVARRESWNKGGSKWRLERVA
jgi:hypothetical protein